MFPDRLQADDAPECAEQSGVIVDLDRLGWTPFGVTVNSRPTLDTMAGAEHLHSDLHVYRTRTAPALGIDAYAQQIYEANLETLTDPLSAGDDHDNP